MSKIPINVVLSNASAEERLTIARLAEFQKSKIHGANHSADWVLGYWKACDDIAAAVGYRLGSE